MSDRQHWYSNTSALTVEAISGVYFDAASETLTAAAPAASIATYLSILDATSNNVLATLADGQVDGQMKRVGCSVIGGNTVTLTLASAVSTSLDVVTFTVIGDTVDLQWNEESGYWRILQLIDTDRDFDTPTVG